MLKTLLIVAVLMVVVSLGVIAYMMHEATKNSTALPPEELAELISNS